MFQLLEYDLPVLTPKHSSLYSHMVESSPRLAAESTGWVGQCIELKDCLQNGAITSSALEKPDESPLWCPGARAASTAQRVLGLPVFEWLLLTIYYGMRTVEPTLQGIATFNAQPGLRASTEPQRSWFHTCDVTIWAAVNFLSLLEVHKRPSEDRILSSQKSANSLITRI
jgi:hypothetical protein